jgi:hypothetical protein
MRYTSVSRKVAGVLAGIVLAASNGAAFAQPVPTTPITPAQGASPEVLMAQIDVTCDTMVQQRKLITPVHVVYASSTWKVVSDPKVAAADRTAATVVFADVWKQNGKYVWVHAHRVDQQGAQRASQLCFRTDGTLARVRQATTIPALDEAGATRAYYYTDGTIIAKIGGYEENDPAVAKLVTSLPYYKNLP